MNRHAFPLLHYMNRLMGGWVSGGGGGGGAGGGNEV